MRDKQLQNLVAKAAAGDKSAFVELCRAKGQAIVYLCVQDMGNQHDGEDAAQEVFIKIQRDITSLTSPAAFNTWLLSVIRHTCFNMRQQNMKKNNGVPLGDLLEDLQEQNLEFLPESYLEREEKKYRLLEIIEQLPRNMRMSIILYYFQGLTYSEIAHARGVSVETVRSSLQRAKAKIREEIAKQQPDAMGEKPVPMAGLAALFRQDAERRAGKTVVLHCLRSAGIQSAAGAMALGTLAKTMALLLCGGSLLALTAALSSHFASVPSLAGQAQNVPQLSVPAVAAGNLPVSDRIEGPVSKFETDAPIALPPAQEKPVPAAQVQSDTPKAAPAAQPAVWEDPSRPTPIAGQVLFKDKAGEEVPGGGRFAQGFTASLLREGVILSQTAVEADGSYRFEELMLTEASTYTLQFSPPSQRSATFTGDNPTGALEIFLVPGEEPETVPVLYITDERPPRVSLRIQNAAGRLSTVNPAKIVITLSDATPTACTWQLVQPGTGAVLHEGDALTIEAPLAALPAPVARTAYLLRVTATDAAGNTAVAETEFYLQ